MKLKRKLIENNNHVDICVTDAYGVAHILFPEQRKELIVVEETRCGKYNLTSTGKGGVRKDKS